MQQADGSNGARGDGHRGDGGRGRSGGGRGERGRPTTPRADGGRGRWRRGARALVGVGALVAGWEALRRHDARAIARDPARASLDDLPSGELRDVVARDGTRLRAELFGPEDAPPLVFVHGWTCARRFWACQVQALADRFRIVTFDLRGHGDSDVPASGDYSTDALADDLQAVLEATVPDGRRALLVGHSLGAMTVVAWAGRHPEEVERRAVAAALMNTGIDGLVDDSLLIRIPRAWRRLRARVGAWFLAGGGPPPSASPLTLRAIRYVALSPSASPAQVAFCQGMTLACPPRVRAGFGRTLLRLDLTGAIGHLTVPTLVLGAARDRLTPPPHVERIAAALPRLSERLLLPKSGHMSPIEDAPSVNAALERLAARVDVTPATAAAG